MKTTLTILFLIACITTSSLYAQNLNTKQQRIFNRQKVNVEKIIRASGTISHLGYGIHSSASTSTLQWRVFRGGNILSESSFYKIVGEDVYHKKAQGRENTGGWLLGTGIAGLVIGGALMIYAYTLPPGGDFYKSIYLNESFSPIFYSGAGGYLIGAVLGLVGGFALDGKSTDYGTAKDTSELYNKELKISISKKF